MTAAPLICIVGPTACGKTARAVQLARHLGGDIISADSRQVYRGMDIGTGKDLDEYPPEVPYHLIDVAPAGYKYNLYEYLRDYRAAYGSIVARGRQPILCGGTGLYVESVLKGISLPEVPPNPLLRAALAEETLDSLRQRLGATKTLHNTTDIDTPARAIRAIEIEQYYLDHPDAAAQAQPHPVENAVVIGIDIPRDDRRRRISQRLHTRLYHQGMISEVQRLLDSGIPAEDLIYYGLEYKFVTRHLIGELTAEEMEQQLETAIHQFAKRQMTWFRGMEKRTAPINWIPWDVSEEEFLAEADKLISCRIR